ncbi:MAG: hypothetical protein Q9217_004068, partial [Psora testacea]
LRTVAILRPQKPPRRKLHDPDKTTHLLIVLGSGGHTAEMLSMLQGLDPRRYNHRTYLFSSGDSMSAERAQGFEAHLKNQTTTNNGSMNGSVMKFPTTQAQADAITTTTTTTSTTEEERDWYIHQVPRARKIHQSLLTTPFSSLYCLLACLRLLRAHPRGWGYPDLVLVNGPATSLILVLATLVVRYFSFLDELPVVGSSGGEKVGRRGGGGARGGEMRTIYVESWARVRKPSLSLKIIYWGRLCGRVFVQWEPLAWQGWGEYRGDLMR